MESVESKIAQDKDYFTARRSADEIIHWLHDFIPTYCQQEAHECIARIFYEHGFELTSRQMRKEYEAWKALTLKGLEPSSPLVKPE